MKHKNYSCMEVDMDTMPEHTNKQKGILGIDAGGTFTDLVFWGESELKVVASAKTPTRHNDLAGTIKSGLELILRHVRPEQIKTFNLATTLATNAIVENKLRSSVLVLIGYDDDLVEKYKKNKIFGVEHIYKVSGGHDIKGEEADAFDEDAFLDACSQFLCDVESVAVSSYFSVRNPSHELRARDLIHAASPRTYVTCGHELASDLDALKRATTASLNAGLIPIVIELFDSVKKVCGEFNIHVPIMVVRGDGSLVSMEWARLHPIETVLSGPAASAIGACYLADAQDYARGACVVDIGGTTTDIISLDSRGRPILNPEGTTVGGHKTLVKSIDIYTFGLGGDSRVSLTKDRKLKIGPRRVKSLCSAASENVAVMECMNDIKTEKSVYEPLVVFYGGEHGARFSNFEQKIMAQVKERPASIHSILKNEKSPYMALTMLEEMEQKGLIEFAGFTPTDALCAIGLIEKWDGTPSKLAAEIIAQSCGLHPMEFCYQVCREVSRIAAKNIFMKELRSYVQPNGEIDGFERALDFAVADTEEGLPAIQLKLNSELIGVGAPSWAFMPLTGELLSESPMNPENAGVAGAVGAAVGTFFLKYAALILPLQSGGFRAHLPHGIQDFTELVAAVAATIDIVTPWIAERAKNAGAQVPIIRYKREDTEAVVAGGIRKMYLSTHIYFDVSDE